MGPGFEIIKGKNFFMKRHLKFKLPLLAAMVAIFAAIAFSVHYDDTPFRSLAHSFVRQGVSSSQIFNVKSDFSAYFLSNISTILNANLTQLQWKSVTLAQIPALIIAESIPTYRGPPTIIS